MRGKSHGGVEIRNIAREPIPSVFFYGITLLYLVKTSHSTDCQSPIYRFSTDKSIPVQYPSWGLFSSDAICHETGSLGLESKVEWLNSEDSKLRREALECGSFGVLNTNQPCASSWSRDAEFTSEAAERNTSRCPSHALHKRSAWEGHRLLHASQLGSGLPIDAAIEVRFGSHPATEQVISAIPQSCLVGQLLRSPGFVGFVCNGS